MRPSCPQECHINTKYLLVFEIKFLQETTPTVNGGHFEVLGDGNQLIIHIYSSLQTYAEFYSLYALSYTFHTTKFYRCR